MLTKSWLTASLCALALSSPGTQAQSAAAPAFPQKPVKIVVPYAPGGITDILARVIGQEVSGALGQPVIVENKAGAGGTIGTLQVTRAEPDGYTLLMGAISPLVISPLATPSLSYDTFKDLTPIIQIAATPLVLVVTPDLPVNSVSELLALLKREPGRLNYSTAGMGAPSHLAGEMFKRQTGVDFTTVHYKGSGAALPDLLSGQIHFMFDSPAPLLSSIHAGRLRAIAVTTPEETDLLPGVPTLASSGVQGVEVTGWYGFLAPASTPPVVIDRLNQAFAQAIRSEAVTQRITGLGAIPHPGSPNDFDALIRREYERWTPVVKEIDLNSQ